MSRRLQSVSRRATGEARDDQDAGRTTRKSEGTH